MAINIGGKSVFKHSAIFCFFMLTVTMVLLSAALAAPRTFVPDVTFTGSSLNGWHPLGQAAQAA
jgi:hypothetical protein